MAGVRPFRGLRYNPTVVDPSLTIAPPYDVISPQRQQELYGQSPYNIVRVEYGRDEPGDAENANKYTRAARDLRDWMERSVLIRDDVPALYLYRQQFDWAGESRVRVAVFAAVRLEPWDAGVIKPHEYTLSNPKEDRMRLLRATRTQVSPVYGIFRPRAGSMPAIGGEPVVVASAEGQHHALERVTDAAMIAQFAAVLEQSDVYIADGHHRYETALAYRDEVRALAAAWTGDEPENFVLMALTSADDPGLLVLPTHRIVTPPVFPEDAIDRLRRHFEVTPVSASVDRLVDVLADEGKSAPSFVALGLAPEPLLLTLRDPSGVFALMPRGQPEAWMRLDVNVLQYGVLADIFGIDDAVLAAGTAVTYTQDAALAAEAVSSGRAGLAFLLNPTPVDQVMTVADAGARMPQKSTFFHPKLPTGLVLRPLD